MTTTAYPLAWPKGWPRTPAGKRKRASFGATKRVDGRSWTSRERLTVAQATKRLMAEFRAWTPRGHVWRVNPDMVVISTNLQVRNDGLPRSSQRAPDDPGVCVYFKLDGVPYAMPCDRWDSVADNIAAVAAHIGAMRGMERWGVGDSRTHFAGFTALPNPDKPRDWRQMLDFLPGQPVSLEAVEARYRHLARIHHPDVAGGSHERMSELNEARALARKDLA